MSALPTLDLLPSVVLFGEPEREAELRTIADVCVAEGAEPEIIDRLTSTAMRLALGRHSSSSVFVIWPRHDTDVRALESAFAAEHLPLQRLVMVDPSETMASCVVAQIRRVLLGELDPSASTSAVPLVDVDAVLNPAEGSNAVLQLPVRRSPAPREVPRPRLIADKSMTQVVVALCAFAVLGILSSILLVVPGFSDTPQAAVAPAPPAESAPQPAAATAAVSALGPVPSPSQGEEPALVLLDADEEVDGPEVAADGPHAADVAEVAGLWVRKQRGSGGWHAAMLACKRMKYLGHDDWNVPSVDQLKALVREGATARGDHWTRRKGSRDGTRAILFERKKWRYIPANKRTVRAKSVCVRVARP